MQDEFPEIRPPTIPDYALLRPIGRGAYGEVWMVQGVTGLLRAAKVVWRDRFSDPAPFEREFRAIQLYSKISLDDPRLLRVLHVGRNDAAGYFYYVMELADSALPLSGDAGPAGTAKRYEPQTLRLSLDRRKRFPLRDALQISADLTRALQSLHQRGLIHRDIKPSNILFIGGMPKLGDVGLVTDIREGATRVGTVGYQPPEPNEPVQPATDIYALGKVLYELVTGNPAAECPRVPREPIPSAERPQWLEVNEIILKATEAQAARRYQSAQELLRDLLQVESGQSVRGWLRLRRQARWLRAAAVVLLAVSLVALAIAETQRRLTAKAVERLEQARYSASQSRIAAGRHRDARTFLEEIRADRKGAVPPEWNLLYGLAFGYPDRVYAGPKYDVIELVPNADSSRLAARTRGDELWVWDRHSTNGAFRGKPVLGLGPFPKEEALPMRLWGAWTNNWIEGIPGLAGPWTLFEWNEGSPWLLVSRDPDRNVLEIRSCERFELRSQLRLTPMHPATETKHQAVSQDGTVVTLLSLLTNDDQAEAFIEQWSADTGRLIGQYPIRKNPDQLSVSPDHRRAAVSYGTTGAPWLYDLQSGRSNLLSDPQLHRGCNVVAFSPTGLMVACGGTDGIVRLWDAGDGHFIENLTGHAPSITALAWSPDGRWLFTGDSLGEIRQWAIQPDARVATRQSGIWNGAWGDICVGTVSPRWAATLANGTVGVWDNPRQRLPRWALTNAFEPIAFSNGDSILWTYDTTAWVRAWDLRNGAPVIESGPVVPDGKRIGRIVVDPMREVAFGIAYDDSSIYRWNLRTHRLEAAATNQFRNAYMLQYCAASDLLVALQQNDAIHGWNASDLSQRFQTPGTKGALAANGMALSPDGRWLAAGSADGRIQILDVLRGTVVQTLKAQTTPVLALAFTPDATGIVASHHGGVISWMDRRTGRERIQFDTTVHQGGGLRGDTFRIGFSADGEILNALTNGGDDSSEVLRWTSRTYLATPNPSGSANARY